MFKKTITYTDFNGKERVEDFYFHLSKAELLAMASGGNEMVQRLQRIIDSQNGRAILEEFRELIREAAGTRSEDGSRFLKTPEAKSMLMDSPAFDELLMELSTNAEASAAFVRELIPEKMQLELKAQMEKGLAQSQPPLDPFKQPEDNRPAWMKENRIPTDEELRHMSHDEMLQAFRHRLG